MATWQFRLVKIVDMGYVTVVYSAFSVLALYSIRVLLGKYDKKDDEKKSSIILFGEILGLLWATSILFYFIRNVIGDYFPSPFHRIAGYNHYRLKEFMSGSVFIYLFMQFFSPLREKLKILYNRHS